ncbi:hypothetical protein ACT2FY_30350 [Paraburkholderia fungorum]|uniref:hypothetical protein n=1 Tax=Paraburkholderia fungorum TaxID=134537 RepID=UPI00402BACA5
MENYWHNFQSLGDNCEFGFVQHRFGSHETSLFRWAAINDYKGLISAIKNSFDGLYLEENLHPRTATLVTDKSYGIAFHTDMPIAEIEGGFDFATSAAERHDTYLSEYDKYRYFAEKFDIVIASEPKIYVVKQEYSTPDIDLMRELLKCLRERGDASLLYVMLSDQKHAPGEVNRIARNFYVGYIDKFAGAAFPDSISISVWEDICKKTWHLHSSSGKSHLRRLAERFSLMRAADDRTAKRNSLDLPPAFNAEHYLLANPDVAASGISASEHYLKFGRTEGRPLRP